MLAVLNNKIYIKKTKKKSTKVQKLMSVDRFLSQGINSAIHRLQTKMLIQWARLDKTISGKCKGYINSIQYNRDLELQYCMLR